MSAGKKAGMDMTQGTIWNKILLFALPLAASSILTRWIQPLSVGSRAVKRWRQWEVMAH